MISTRSRLKCVGWLTLFHVLLMPERFMGQASGGSTVVLSPGDDVNAAVTAAPEGTTFLLKEGVYRMQQIIVKNDDTFRGEGHVVLNGSQVLSFLPDTSGSGLWVANAAAMPYDNGTCASTTPLCGYVQDLFIDDVLQARVGNTQALVPGTWFFDMSNGKAYIPEDPTGHIVEIGMTQYALLGRIPGLSGVTISNLTIEKYAVQAQFAAIGAENLGVNWIVDHCEVRWNHGVGINVGSGSTISNSYIHHNGQLGFQVTGADVSIINNEISWNNYAGYATDWSGGADHFSQATNTVLRDNYIHDNNSPAMWGDTNNIDEVIENNVIMHNAIGIRHEKSYSVTIDNNVLKGNTDMAIYILASSDANIYNNMIEVPENAVAGIGMTNATTASGAYGPFVTANNYIHDNIIIYRGPQSFSGLVNDSGGDQTQAFGNLFDYNHYILLDGGSLHWEYFSKMDWDEYQAAGQEPHGTCCSQ